MSSMNRYILHLLLKGLTAALLIVLWYGELDFSWAGRFEDNFQSLLGFTLFAVLLNFTMSILSAIYRIRKKVPLDAQDNMTKGINNIYILIMSFAVVLLLLSMWGVDAQTLFTTLSIIAAAIAIVSKEFLIAILAGLVIAVSKELSIGDYIKIGDHKGKIVDLQLTKIVILNEDDDIIYIPNDKAYLGEIVNFSKGDERRVSVAFELSSKFDGGIDDLEGSLISNLSEFKEHIVSESFKLKIAEIQKDCIKLKFQYTLQQAGVDLEKVIKRKTIRKVLDFIRAAQFHEEQAK